MSFGYPLRFSLYLSWKKVLRTKIFFFFIAGFIVLLAIFWWQAGYLYARRFFFSLFPYLFLLIAQDIFREEIDSGSLENVIFIRFNFRSYLQEKNISLFLLATIASTLVFVPFLLTSLWQGDFSWAMFSSFFAGLMAGLYYISLAGLLGLRLRSGSNVLAIILIQVFLFLGLLVTSTSGASGRDIIDLLISGQPQGSRERFILFSFLALWPNALTSRTYRSLGFKLEALALIFLFLGLQAWRLGRLELKRE